MKSVEFWNWKITNEITGRRKTSRWKMTREDAMALDPTAEPVATTWEVRQLPETPEEGSSVIYDRDRTTS